MINFSNINDEFISEITRKNRELNTLNLSGCILLNDQTTTYLKDLTKLTALDLSGCRGIASSIYNLKSVESLVRLMIDGIDIHSNDLKFVEYLQKLNILSLDNTNLTREGLAVLSKTRSSLEKLSLKFNLQVTEDMLYDCIIRLPRLSKVLADSSALSDRIRNQLRLRL